MPNLQSLELEHVQFQEAFYKGLATEAAKAKVKQSYYFLVFSFKEKKMIEIKCFFVSTGSTFLARF